jgi:hypothetical protein
MDVPLEPGQRRRHGMSRRTKRKERRLFARLERAWEQGFDVGFESGWDEAMEFQRQVHHGRPPEGRERVYPRGHEPPALPRKSG